MPSGCGRVVLESESGGFECTDDNNMKFGTIVSELGSALPDIQFTEVCWVLRAVAPCHTTFMLGLVGCGTV